MFNSTSNKPKVYKQRTLMCPRCYPNHQYASASPWIGDHPQLGTEHFDTWREAYDYARLIITSVGSN